MSVLDGHSPTDLAGEWPFEHRVDDLRMVGVSLAVEQERLFNSVVNYSGGVYSNGQMIDEHLWAMTVEVVPDPEGDPSDTKPMEVWTEDEQMELLVVPRLVRLDWNLWPDLDVLDPDWRRFPSLPGQTVDEDGEMCGPEAFRLWNLWPLNHDDQINAHDAYQSARYSSWLLGLDEYMNFRSGVYSSCEMAHGDDAACDTPLDDPRWYERHDDSCPDAHEWARSMRATYVHVDDDGIERWKAPPERWYRLLWPTNELWHRLLGFSARNAWASLRACPDGVLQDERRYSPWLWSS